jgi:hypothetical protein
MTFDEGKLKELILYIARKSENDPNFGKTKLIKLLAWSDFLAYGRMGAPLTGATYQKREFGPAPKQFPGALNLLRAMGRIRQVEEETFSYTQDRVLALDDPDMSGFTAEQVALVDEVVANFLPWNNTAMSEESHREFVGWAILEEGDVIPYHTVFLSPAALTDADRQHGHRVAAADGLLVAS